MRKYQNCLLDPAQSVIMIVDEQPQLFFGVESTSCAAVVNNAIGLARTARLFQVPCILTTVAATTFAGPMYSKIQAVYPASIPIDRTAINAWEDPNVQNAVEKTGRKNLIIAGLWTEVGVTFSALSALEDGYDVYIVADASAGTTKQAHQMAIQRMVQAGVKPVTWEQVLFEFQRDWSKQDTYSQVMEILKEHGGACGIGAEYAETFLS